MGKLADRMPVVDAFIDELRAMFGREAIDRAIVEGLRDGTFHARENGYEVGVPVAIDQERAVCLADMVLLFPVEPERRGR